MPTGDGEKQKFMFDLNSFDTPDPEDEVPPEPMYSETEVNKIKEDSFQYGKSMGVEETRQAQEEVLISLMKQVEVLVAQLVLAEMKREEENNNAIIRLSLQMVQKLFPKFGEDNAIEEIEHMVKDILVQRKDEPRLVITVHDSILDKLQERVDQMAQNAGFQGAVILMASTDLLQTDCRVEWADGGADRNFNKIFSELERCLSKQLSHQAEVLDSPKEVAEPPAEETSASPVETSENDPSPILND